MPLLSILWWGGDLQPYEETLTMMMLVRGMGV